jgi:hypothetical protein
MLWCSRQSNYMLMPDGWALMWATREGESGPARAVRSRGGMHCCGGMCTAGLKIRTATVQRLRGRAGPPGTTLVEGAQEEEEAASARRAARKSARRGATMAWGERGAEGGVGASSEARALRWEAREEAGSGQAGAALMWRHAWWWWFMRTSVRRHWRRPRQGGVGVKGGEEALKWCDGALIVAPGHHNRFLPHSLPHPPHQCARYVRAHWCACHIAVGAADGTATSLILARVYSSRHMCKAFQL